MGEEGKEEEEEESNDVEYKEITNNKQEGIPFWSVGDVSKNLNLDK